MLTEDEHIKLNKIGDEFCLSLAEVTATFVAQFPEAIEETIVTYLQDRTSLYSPFTVDHMRAIIKQLRTRV